MSKFSKRLKKWRTDSGWTQAELAKKVFVSVQTVSRWECDESEPNLDTLVMLSEIFDVTTDSLIGKEDIPQKELERYIRNSILEQNQKKQAFCICRNIIDGMYPASLREYMDINKNNFSEDTYTTVQTDDLTAVFSNREQAVNIFAMVDLDSLNESKLRDERLHEFFSQIADSCIYNSLIKLYKIPSDKGYDKKALSEKLEITEDSFERITNGLRRLGCLSISDIRINGNQVKIYFPHANRFLLLLLSTASLIRTERSHGQINNFNKGSVLLKN